MKLKKMAGLLAVVAAAGILGGCSGENTQGTTEKTADKTSVETQGEAAADAVTIQMFTRFSDGASKEFFEQAAAAFHEENPNITVELSSADNANYKQEINVKLASNDAPDIYFAWSGVYAEKFAVGGRALDLTSYVKDNTEWSDHIIANQFGPFTFDGKIYGIPLIMDGKAFYYNKDIFEELNLEVPETWEEFMEVLNTLKGTDYIPISLGNQEDWATGHYMTTLNQRMVSAEVLAKDYALEGDFSDSAYIEALDRLMDLTPYFTPEFNSTSYDTGISDFINGKAAIYYEQFNQVQYIAPAEFEWSWFDFPDIAEGKGDQNALTGAPQGLMVSGQTKHPEEAVKFLQYLTTLDMASRMVKDTKMISCVEGAITTETADEKLVEIAETIKKASSINLWLDNAVDSEVAASYMAGIQAMAGGSKTAEAVMADVQKKAEEVKADQ